YTALSLFFFFFQAEDGIRDRNVTGVQTCALPISCRKNAGQGPRWPPPPPLRPEADGHHPDSGECGHGKVPQNDFARDGLLTTRRSEERRVGKECRSGWSAVR